MASSARSGPPRTRHAMKCSGRWQRQNLARNIARSLWSLFAIKKSFAIDLQTSDVVGRELLLAPILIIKKWKREGPLSSHLQWQRYGGRKDTVGIEESLQLLQSAGIGPVCMSDLLVVVRSQHVGITSRQCVRRQVFG